MQKKKYYVSVGSGVILEDQTAATYEYEIEATSQEVRELKELFDKLFSNEWDDWLRAHTPYIQYHLDNPNDADDEALRAIYSCLHRLGTPKSKEHIEKAGLMDYKSTETM